MGVDSVPETSGLWHVCSIGSFNDGKLAINQHVNHSSIKLGRYFSQLL